MLIRWFIMGEYTSEFCFCPAKSPQAALFDLGEDENAREVHAGLGIYSGP
jgi:hypothetical protein